jgi:hypothetical protein
MIILLTIILRVAGLVESKEVSLVLMVSPV